jgi:hypothetical protein
VAAEYEVITSYEDVEFLGGAQTRDVLVTGIRTKPSGIYIEVRIPMTVYKQIGAPAVASTALGFRNIYELLLQQEGVAGVQWGQVSKNGQLADVAVVTVSSSSGNSEATLEVPYSKLAPTFDEPMILKLRKQLDATEAL